MYDGVYHVLQGAIDVVKGIGPNDIRLKELMLRLRDDVDEIILAIKLKMEGEATATYITRLVKPLGIKVTQLASGIPMGRISRWLIHERLQGRSTTAGSLRAICQRRFGQCWCTMFH